MAYPAIRLFGFDQGIRNTWTDTSHPTAQAYASAFPRAQMIAFEVNAVRGQHPQTDQEFFNRALAAIKAGNHLGPLLMAMTHLEMWARSVGVYASATITAAAPATTVRPVGPYKPPPAMPVEAHHTAAFDADKAWAAVIALSKGSGS